MVDTKAMRGGGFGGQQWSTIKDNFYCSQMEQIKLIAMRGVGEIGPKRSKMIQKIYLEVNNTAQIFS